MPEDSPPPKSRMRRLLAMLNHNWIITVFGGLLVIFLTPLVTGFAELTFRSKSWEMFGISNAANTPGSYLAPDAVYRVPLEERFRVDGDLLLSASWRYDDPHVSLTNPTGRGNTVRVSSTKSMYLDGNCKRVAVHLMRMPQPEDSEFFLMYTTQPFDTPDCQGFWARLFPR